MRRFFSEFLTGWPALGLLLLRLALTAGVLTQNPSAPMIERGASFLVLLGFATPLCGASVALLELKQITSSLGAARPSALIATIGVALALVGPGAWSIDARLFGWRQIRIPARRKTESDSRSN